MEIYILNPVYLKGELFQLNYSSKLFSLVVRVMHLQDSLYNHIISYSLPIYLSVDLFIYPSFYMNVCLFVNLSFYLSVYLYMSVCICRSIYLYDCLSHSIHTYLSLLVSISFVYGCRIHRLHLCSGVRPTHNGFPGYNTKQSDGEVPVMLGLWGMQCTPSLTLLPGSTLARCGSTL